MRKQSIKLGFSNSLQNDNYKQEGVATAMATPFETILLEN